MIKLSSQAASPAIGRVLRAALRAVGVRRRTKAQALARLVRESGLFDPDWYLANNLDLAKSGIDPLHHFVHHGAIEQRDPGPGFETDLYVESYPDWRDGYASPIEHYLHVGKARGHLCAGAPPYERWIADHDALTPADEARIRSDAERSPVPKIVFAYVLDEGACLAIGAIADGLRSQLGVAWTAHLTPARSVPASLWEATSTAIADSCVRWHAGPDEVADAVPPEAVVVLCLGPVVLRPHAGYLFGRTLQAGGAKAAYADHDTLGEDGRRGQPVFKPEPSPEYLRRVSYAGPAVATLAGADAMRAALRQASAADGALDLAALDALVLALPPEEVSRVPFVLYHVAGPDDRRPYRPLNKAPDLLLTLDSGAGSLPSVDVVIPTRDRVGLLRECLGSLRVRTLYPPDRLTVTVVDNESVESETLSFLEESQRSGAIRLVRSPGRFNFSRINNDAAFTSRAEVLVFLNNDTTVLRPDWLLQLVRHAMRDGTGAVGAKLLYPDGTVQHGGVALGVQGVGAHRLVGQRPEEAGPLEATREMTSITGACLAIRRALFAEIGGFDPVLEVAFNDTSLCARLFEAGYRNLYVAEPLIVHHESKSRGFDDTPEKARKQAREAIYARTRFRRLFQDDPSYSPNKSLQKVDELAFPPRVLRPWRKPAPGGRRVLFLSRVHQEGNGVPVVLGEQAAFFRGCGWEVIVGGPISARDRAYPGCERVTLVSARQAASYAATRGVDCVIAHTPPFFSVVRFLGAEPPVYFVDHGEPPPDLFAERVGREAANWEKRFCAPMATRVFAISETIRQQQFRPDVTVIRNGNSHLATWSADWEVRRLRTREAMGLADRFVVLNVSRFAVDDRRYKGVDRYLEVASEFGFLFPDLKERVAFLVTGRGGEGDIALLRQEGVAVHPNVSDAEMQDLYAAADLYMSFSLWEGYNLGIGQALAMGLPVIASDIPAHREFPIFTANDVLPVCNRLAEHAAGHPRHVRLREAFVEDWREPNARLEALVAADVAAAGGGWPGDRRAGRRPDGAS